MSAVPKYPNRWTPMECICKGCGTEYRLDVELILGIAIGQGYQHCSKDEEGKMLPGPIIAVWEKRNNDWKLVGTRS